jgi:hypothetical protein
VLVLEMGANVFLSAMVHSAVSGELVADLGIYQALVRH